MSFVFRFVRSRIMILCFIISGIRSCFFKLVEIHRLFLNNQISVQTENPEREGFEPSVGYPTQTFEIRTLNHSDTSPADKNILAQSKLKYNLV